MQTSVESVTSIAQSEMDRDYMAPGTRAALADLSSWATATRPLKDCACRALCEFKEIATNERIRIRARVPLVEGECGEYLTWNHSSDYRWDLFIVDHDAPTAERESITVNGPFMSMRVVVGAAAALTRLADEMRREASAISAEGRGRNAAT